MKQYQITITKGIGKDRKVTQRVSSRPYDYNEKMLWSSLSSLLSQGMSAIPRKLKEGESASSSVNVSVTIKCLMNRRAQRRAPEVIAAEKAAQQTIQQAKLAQDAEQEKRQQKIMQQRQKRISNQIDHAFKSGSDFGSEPVSKFVTCQNCDAPATFLTLNHAVPSGAAVLDETSVTGAVCDEHNYSNNPYHRTLGAAEYFPISRLEFFYTGIRQIGIKEKP